MRSSYIVLFFTIWLCLLLRPFTPLLSDAYQHTFNATQHHSMMHRLGVIHTDAEIGKIMNDTGTADTSKALSSHVENPFVFINASETMHFFQDICLIAFGFNMVSIEIYSADKHIPPPKFA